MFPTILTIFALILLLEGMSILVVKNIHKVKRLSLGVESSEFIASKSSRYRKKNIQISIDKLFEPRPYGLYWNSANYHENGQKQTDLNGFRYKGYDVSKEKRLFRVLVYGGSTTFSNHFISDPKMCWPYQTENLTNLELLHETEFINAGLNWATSAELLIHFIIEGRDFQPDLLIIEGPGNDALPISLGDFTSDYRNTRHSISWQIRKYESFWLNHFMLVRLFYIFWLRNQNILNLRPDKNLAREDRNQFLLNTYPYAYKRNIETFIHQAEALGIMVILIDFLVNFNALDDDKPGLSKGLISQYTAMNGVLEDMARKNPNTVKYISIPKELFTNSDFADTVHLNQVGESKKAEYLSKHLVPIIQFILERKSIK